MHIHEQLQYKFISAFLAIVILAPEVAWSDPKNVPLKVSLVTQEQVGYTPTCPSKFGGTLTGTGKSTHMGKVTLLANDCITPMENGFTFKGTFELTAANGDKLTGGYSGTFTPINSGPTYSLSDAELQITGGTGRFSKASGSAELEGTQNTLTGKGKMEANGTISY
ncbi:hypothetical protein SAMN05216420_10283 [Nitrosospira sp. Nl5]|uniref:hypothetical protein n=1 Tax=Nitrosospira sp. Nl5 TaxID=200120 RepID=UPI000888755B|nr:hypothetical protein [Nitrosospira sp. Nl5]SCY03764.1 hypothetical protein SAMN05216420_10283 [Nitrosospira sp. Nl5]